MDYSISMKQKGKVRIESSVRSNSNHPRKQSTTKNGIHKTSKSVKFVGSFVNIKYHSSGELFE